MLMFDYHPDGSVTTYRWNHGIVVGDIIYARGWVRVACTIGPPTILYHDGESIFWSGDELVPGKLVTT